jgi:hypothetical protein
MAEFTVTFRAALVGEPVQMKTAEQVVEAQRVEGWGNDYAFLSGDREVMALIPRDLVSSVRKVGRTTEDRQVEYWVAVSNLDQTTGSQEGPFWSRREAEEYGERQGSRGLVWNIVTK